MDEGPWECGRSRHAPRSGVLALDLTDCSICVIAGAFPNVTVNVTPPKSKSVDKFAPSILAVHRYLPF
jgi:hypothetical protein